MRLIMRLHATALMFAALAIMGIAGCDQKEKVLDIETRDGGVEVFEDQETGAVDVEVDTPRE